MLIIEIDRFSALPMTKASLPAFIQASAVWAAARKGHVNELREVSAPVSLRELHRVPFRRNRIGS